MEPPTTVAVPCLACGPCTASCYYYCGNYKMVPNNSLEATNWQTALAACKAMWAKFNEEEKK